MRHALTALLCLLCGGCCAKGCPTFGERVRLAYKRHELRMVLVDWGVKPHLLPLLLCLLLPSCAFYRGDGTTFIMAGTNAQSVSAGGLRMEGVNQTAAKLIERIEVQLPEELTNEWANEAGPKIDLTEKERDLCKTVVEALAGKIPPTKHAVSILTQLGFEA